MKKFLCLLITVLMILVSGSFAVFAQESETDINTPQDTQNSFSDEQTSESIQPTEDVTNKGPHNKVLPNKDNTKVKKEKTKTGEDSDKIDKKAPKTDDDPAKVNKETPKAGEDPAKIDKKTPKTDDNPAKITKVNLKASEDSAIKEKIKTKVAEKRKQNDKSIPVFIKDKEVKFDVPPVIKSGRTLIPVRAITNALGADVEWDAKTQTVTVSKAVYDSVYGVSTTVITLKLDSDIILVNGKEVKIDVPAQLVSNRTMVPIRFIAQALNHEIDFDDETGAVLIEEEEEDNVDVEVKLEAFKAKLKDKHQDKALRKALLRKISELKKLKNDFGIMVFIKGNEVEFDIAPVIKSGRTLIPVRAVSNALGANVDWNSDSKTITITKSAYGNADNVVKITLDSDIALVNGKEVKIDVPAQSINNRTMVPLRFIAIVLNQEVEYDSETGAVTIEDADENN